MPTYFQPGRSSRRPAWRSRGLRSTRRRDSRHAPSMDLERKPSRILNSYLLVLTFLPWLAYQYSGLYSLRPLHSSAFLLRGVWQLKQKALIYQILNPWLQGSDLALALFFFNSALTQLLTGVKLLYRVKLSCMRACSSRLSDWTTAL
jgi:hypothetical protein